MTNIRKTWASSPLTPSGSRQHDRWCCEAVPPRPRPRSVVAGAGWTRRAVLRGATACTNLQLPQVLQVSWLEIGQREYAVLLEIEMGQAKVACRTMS